METINQRDYMSAYEENNIYSKVALEESFFEFLWPRSHLGVLKVNRNRCIRFPFNKNRYDLYNKL